MRVSSHLAALGTAIVVAFGLAATALAAAEPVKLSSCTLDADGNVTIGASPGCGTDVYVDKSFLGANGLGYLTIQAGATLSIPDTRDVTLETTGISVAGTLSAGSASKPFSNVATIRFTDAAGTAVGKKGITVASGGSLQLFGKSGVAATGGRAPSWTHLAAPAGPSGLYGAGLGVASPVGSNGATVLTVADQVDWKQGDWIVVAGTDFSPDSAEFVLVDSVTCTAGGSCTVTLDSSTPLVTYHYGGTAPDSGAAAFDDGVSQNYGVDERAEVGLISRNIRLTAAVTTAHPHNGGEIMIMSGFAGVSIQGVEIEKFGKPKLGSYPIHFHQAGTVTAGSVLVDSNSIHHSYNKCVVLHSTNGVTVSNNVCARAVGHLFYLEAGDETNLSFIGNLGIGAMSNGFSIAADNTAAAAAFWAGDYLVRGYGSVQGNGYDGFNVAFSDDTSLVVGTSHTSSGFWLTNLGGNTLTGNSIAGCQAFGRGFWILPAQSAATAPPASFKDNRAHGCYAGFDTASDNGVTNAFLFTPQGACLAGPGKGTSQDCDVVASFDGLTATRNRNRGIWVRASWYALHDARLATNRDGVSLVSSGGSEGSPPGEWGLLKDAIVVGISANNPLRFGPCPYDGQNGFGGNAGCWDVVYGNGYPIPNWNLAGVMFYDGPARLETVRFVNFNVDVSPYLTAADLSFLDYYSANNKIPCHASQQFVYEGDAAIGWFQSNENSYPPTQYSQNLTFDNVDLRHQVYTENVELTCANPPASVGSFRDGDKFTVILDRDGSLTDYTVVEPKSGGTTGVAGAYPISLNNLPFLAGPDTADECHSTGAQDAVLEGRPTSLISPYSYATLEFQALTGCDGTSGGTSNCVNDNVMLFTKDQKDYGGTIQFSDIAISTDSNLLSYNCGGAVGGAGEKGHACVALTGRNGNGVYEPKLVNGLGYTVGASKGMPGFVGLMYTDAHLPAGISSTNPFKARVGICFKNGSNAAPAKSSGFTVKKGRWSFASPNGNPATLKPGYFEERSCTGLANVMCGPSGTADCFETICPSSPSTAFKAVDKVADLDDSSKCPKGECYFYDSDAGMLFLNVAQTSPNAGGAYSSPLGSCDGTAGGDCADSSFYSCPAEGCEAYTVEVTDASYQPASGASACTPYGGIASYEQPYPPGMNRLAYAVGGTVGPVVETKLENKTTAYPHRAPDNEPQKFCPTNAPKKPGWKPAPAGTTTAAFTLGLPASLTDPTEPVTATVAGAEMLPGTPLVLMSPGASYTLTASQPSCDPTTDVCSCSQKLTVNAAGDGYTSTGSACCGIAGSGGTAIGVGTPSNWCGVFQAAGSAGMTFKIDQGVTAVTPMATNLYKLVANTSYSFTAIRPSSCDATTEVCSCTQDLTVDAAGNGFTSSGAACCGLPASGGTTLAPGASSNWCGVFRIAKPPTVTVGIDQGTTPLTPMQNPSGAYKLSPNTSYTLSATEASPCGATGTQSCSCKQSITVDAAGDSVSSGGKTCCGLPSPSGSPLILGAAPYACAGP